MEARGFAIPLPSMSGAEPWTLGKIESEMGGRKYGEGDMSKRAHGSPMTKLSPAFTEGTKPSEPTSAAAASLVMLLQFRSS